MPRSLRAVLLPILLLAAAGFVPLRAEVDWSASAPDSIDTLPPRLTVLAPPPNSLYLGGDQIFFAWQCEEPHPHPTALYNEAVVYAEGDSVAGRRYSPFDSTYQWTWIAPELPSSQAILEITARDAWGNVSVATSEWFTILPAGSPVEAGPKRRFALLPASPNPFNPQTRIRLELDRGGEVAVEVFDARGRRVRTLHSGYLDEGAHEMIWDGTDDEQRRVAGGLYLVSLVRRDGPAADRRVGKVVLTP